MKSSGSSFQTVINQIKQGRYKPIYLVVGEEPYQTTAVLNALRKKLLTDEMSAEFNYESWDGEGLDGGKLTMSLDTLPGLFDTGLPRLISCSHFDKASATALSELEGYFKNPSETTCFFISAKKADKRKSWVKAAIQKGEFLEVKEPYDRQWPSWRGYFETQLGKQIDVEGWEILVESCARSLSLVNAELQKISVYVGKAKKITKDDIVTLVSAPDAAHVFEFVDDVLCRRQLAANRKYHELKRAGENEIKLLSLLVRQFRLVDECRELVDRGVTDSRTLASELGVHPFFVSQLTQQVRFHNRSQLRQEITLLGELDYRLKVGESSVFQGFMLPYFKRNGDKMNSEMNRQPQ